MTLNCHFDEGGNLFDYITIHCYHSCHFDRFALVRSVTLHPKNDWRKLTFCFLSAQSWASGRHTLPLHPGYTSVPRASLAPLRVTPFRPNSPRFRLFCLGRGRFCLRLGLRLFCWPSTTRMHTRASRSAWGSSRLVGAHC